MRDQSRSSLSPATRRAAAWLLCAVAAAACHGDSTAPPRIGAPAHVSAVTSTAQAKGTANSAAPVQPTIKVVDSSGKPVPGVAVAVSVVGGGTLANGAPVTDANGSATTGVWTLGAFKGVQTVTMSVATLPSVVFTVDAAAFHITIRYIGTPPGADVQAAFSNAVTRIQQEIADSLPSQPLVGVDANACLPGAGTLNETVHDLLIFVSVNSDPPFDGPGGLLGFAGPCGQRDASPYLPFVGAMEFDAADVPTYVTNGLFSDIVLHEMHHVLGFGTIWSPLSDVLSIPNMTQGYGTSNPVFLGAQARAQYVALGGTAPVGVPLENTGTVDDGTNFSHWRETTFKSELMTGFYNFGPNPLSKITIASLGDLGYTVDLSAADIYLVPAPGNLQSNVVLPAGVREGLRTPTIFVDARGHQIAKPSRK